MTQFKAGDSGSIGGIGWRVVQGKKSAGDLRLDVRAPNWVAPQMSIGFLFADFYTQNERTLAQENYLARSVATAPGDMYLRFITASMDPHAGWEAAKDLLELQRQLRREREAA